MKEQAQFLLPLLAAVAFLSVNSSARSAEMDDVLATVNNDKITQQMFDTYVKRRGVKDLGTLKAEQKKSILEELINRELLYRVAINDSLDKKPEIKTELSNIQRNLFAAAAVREIFASQGPVTDKLLRAEYEKFIKDLPSKEYKARHILSESEKTAKAIVAELDKGAKFVKLAEKKSTGPSGKSGGDLGWFRAGQMLPSFSQAVAKLKKGKYTKKPIQTQYGWHVILLEDERSAPPPGFEDIKEQLKMSLNNKQMENYINALKANAKIKIY